MPSLDIATAQPSLQTHLVPLGVQSIIHTKTLPNPWKSSQLPKKVKLYEGHLHIRRGKLLITAVATLEPKFLVRKEDEQSNSTLLTSSNPSKDQNKNTNEDSEQLDEREQLRRMRISKANKGNTPWNKGRKHSPETLQKIRERTKLAMQNPKVKMKLVYFGHAQSEETKAKIGIGVRIGWERRRVKQMVQETCHFEWQNLIADVARRGCTGEEELQWHTYKILDEQLTKEWLESVEQRKTMPRLKASKRAPKSPEQRRKIAEAIAAKWADPEYRERVCSGLAKYHGTATGAERKPRRKPSSSSESRRRTSATKSTSDPESSSDSKSQIQQPRLRKRNAPMYRDPLASSKLEMIKNIRAKRAVTESKKNEAIERARLLIAEAEKAAKALEVAATKSPAAQASLLESRMLIAEATHLIESVENGRYSSVASPQLLRETEEVIELDNRNARNGLPECVNGTQIFPLSGIEGCDFADLTSQDKLNCDKQSLPSSSNSHGLPNFSLDNPVKQFDYVEHNGDVKSGKNPMPNGNKVYSTEPNGNIEFRSNPPLNGNKVPIIEGKELPSKQLTVTKKWVRGRLIEVTDEA